jgi:hypothetical protein
MPSLHTTGCSRIRQQRGRIARSSEAIYYRLLDAIAKVLKFSSRENIFSVFARYQLFDDPAGAPLRL